MTTGRGTKCSPFFMSQRPLNTSVRTKPNYEVLMSYISALSQMRAGRANPSDYQVEIPTDDRDTIEYVRYFCRAVTLPAINHSVTQLRGQENIGIARNIFTGKSYGSPVVMTFSERSDLIMYRTLKAWMDSAFQNSEQTGDRSLRAGALQISRGTSRLRS